MLASAPGAAECVGRAGCWLPAWLRLWVAVVCLAGAGGYTAVPGLSLDCASFLDWVWWVRVFPELGLGSATPCHDITSNMRPRGARGGSS